MIGGYRCSRLESDGRIEEDLVFVSELLVELLKPLKQFVRVEKHWVTDGKSSQAEASLKIDKRKCVLNEIVREDVVDDTLDSISVDVNHGLL